MSETPINLSGTPTYKKAQGASVNTGNLSVAKTNYNPLDDTSRNYESPKTSGYEASTVTMADVAPERTGRFKTVMYGYDNEEAAAQRQSFLDKAANGILKGANLTATTVAGGFGMLYGAIKSPFSGRLADIWDNPIMTRLDEWNTKVDQEYLPNYYTKAETEAEWYSPTNWMTANFLFDKLIKNSGFAVGAMVSGNIMNAGLLRAGSLLGRAAAEGATLAEASQAFKIFSPLLRNTSRAFSAAKNIEAAAALEKPLLSIADVTATSSELASIAKTTGQFAKFSDAARRTAIAAYSSAGEASFEALQTAKEYRESLIQEYVDKYGEQPIGQSLEQINLEADKVGKTSFLGNIALLSVTEFAQLPYLLGSSYKNTRQAANAFSDRVDDVLLKDGKYIATPGATGVKKGFEKAGKIGSYIFDPKEAGQEIGQFALQVGTQNYFSKANKTGDADVLVDGFLYGLFGRDEMGEGVGALVSKEGLESGLLGGLTGGPMQAMTAAKERKYKAENTQRFLTELNRTPSFKESFKDRMSSVNRGVVLQQQHEAAIITGNELEARDLSTDMMHNYLAPRIKYGRFDMVMDDVNDLKMMGSTETGLAELKAQGIANINDTVQSFQKRLSKFESVANNTNEIYNSLYLRYSGELKENGEKKYSPYVLDKMAYAASKIADYDLRIPQLNSILLEKGILVGDLLETSLKGARPSREVTAGILNEINDLPTTSTVKDGLKTALQDIITLGERRKTFIDEYEDIKSNPLNYESDPEFQIGDKVEIPLDIKGVKEEVEIGKEYSLKDSVKIEDGKLVLAPKLTVLSQTLGGELEVRMPGGKIKFIAPENIKSYELSEEDNASPEMESALYEAISNVLSKDEYKDIKVPENVDPLDYINSLGDDKLISNVNEEFGKISQEIVKRKAEEKRKQDELIKNKAALDAQQEALQKKSGTISTPPPLTPEELQKLAAEQGKLKAASKLFISGTTPTEREDEPVFIKNSREFLNNAKNFKNRADLSVILVTPNQETALGLSGLTAMSYGPNDASEANNVETGFIAQVFVEQDGGKVYFVDKSGKRLGEVGKPVDIQQVIFQTMPTPSLKDRSGNARFRADEMTEAEAASKAWAVKRKEIFDAEAFPLKAYKFNISRGIPVLNVVDGKYERNQIGDILIPENKIATQEGLLQIVVQGSVSHNGENLKFNNGLTVLQYGDTLQILNNNTLGDAKANAVYLAIKTMMDKFQTTKKLDPALASYIQNVLFWKKTDKTSGNQIFINASTGQVSLGGQNYSPADIINKKSEIINQLKQTYHSINNTTLRDNFYDKFYEYKAEGDKLVEVEWPNYQSYLLSKKGRSADQTPLVTSVAKPTEAVPYSYKQKYATLVDFELPVIQAPKEEAKPATTAPKIGEFIMDGETSNTFTGFNSGPVNFTGSINVDGSFTLEVLANDTIEKIASNEKLVNDVIVPDLKKINKFDPSADDIQLVTDYVAFKLVVELNNIKNAETEKAAPVSEEVKPMAPPEVIVEQELKTDEEYNPEDTSAPDDEYMRVGGKNVPVLDENQIEIFKAWAAEKVPTIPYEVLDNLVTTYDNDKAFGVFEKGVAKFYKGAPGTAPYHEVFEGIWKGFLTPDQRQDVLNEFKNRKGQFTDRASGKKINYAEATDQQAKERIADDFAEFRVGKLPARSLGEKILKFFRNIIEFFKSFVQKPSMKEELFKAIDSGKFKQFTLPKNIGLASPEYMRIPGLTETQTYEFVQDMTARAAQYIFGDSKKSLYDIKEITGTDIFNKIKEAYTKEGKYKALGDERYNKLIVRTRENLRTLGINFNEEDTIDINDENVNNKDYAPEPFSTDWKKTSPFAIKFVVATLPQVEPGSQKNESSLSLPKRVLSTIKGYKLSSFGAVFNTLLDKLSNTTSVKNLEDKTLDLAKSDATYVRFFQRVGGDLSTGTINFANFKNEDWRLFVNFFQTFTKQKPEALIQYVDGNSVYTAPANQFTASKLLQSEWFENMKMLADKKDSVIKRNRLEKKFVVDKNKLPNAVPKDTQDMLEFLSTLGVNFPISVYNSLTEKEKNDFSKAVGGIYTYIQKTPEIGTLQGKTLGINSQLAELSNLYIKVTNPSQDTTYFGVEGQRIQSYAENNVPSVMENEFNSINTVEELKQLRPELNDVFTKNSVTLKDGGNFFNIDGEKIRDIKVGYIQGTKIVDSNKGVTTSKLTLGKRYTQEINQNLNGDYYILVPADGSTEWEINLGNHFSYTDVAAGRAFNKVNQIFRGYLTDEIALALDADNRKKIKFVGSKAKQLRFFREILDEKNVAKIEEMIANGDTQEQIELYIDQNIDSINEAIKNFIETTVKETKELLIKNGEVVYVTEDKIAYSGLQDKFAGKNDINKFNMNEEDINNLLTFINANYIINNIELHKLFFGDPYEFKIKDNKLDETKRIKSFLSPRRTTFDSPEFNTFLNDEYNMAGDVKLSPEDLGYHLHKSFTNTVTLSDINLYTETYSNVNEADAGSMIMDNTYREVKLKNGQWTTAAENWHQWQMAYTRNKLATKKEYKYSSEALREHDFKLINSPEPKFVVEELKPIVSGVKAGETIIDNVLDKFSQMPLYYKHIEGTNLEKLYTKMWKENIGYVVFESGRKVGATELYSLYSQDGSFNAEPFNNLVKVPWKAYGIQVENAYENPKDQTRGSQLTKLSSLDLYDNGEASPEAKKAYERNLKALDRLHQNGYDMLLKKLGLEDLGDGFVLKDPKAVQETLEYELLRREMSENAKDTIKLDDNGQFIIPFESSPAYRQIKDILFSMVNKSLSSMKMNGGPKVQVPVTGWENIGEQRGIALKTEKGYRKISKEQYENLSEEEKKNVVLTSGTLKFYTKEDPYIEVMLPHWFRNKFSSKKFPTDESILKYLNKTEEGRSILRGVGFRIPTQAMSSIETFRVKGFLPQSMGDTIILPSEITSKAGSDFDIDKMNTYLKSVYVDKNGDVKLVKYKGSEEATREFYAKVFDENLENQKVKKAELLEAAQILSYGLDDPKNLVERYSDLLDVLLAEAENSSEFEVKMMEELEKLGDVNFQNKLKDKFVDDMYNRSLQNEYYESLEELITLPENFERLIAPVGDAGLPKLAEQLDDLRGQDETKIKNRLLNRNYMTSLRHAFVTAKKWVGIAAVNITGQSLTQKSKIYIDPANFETVSDFDRSILGDGSIKLPHNKVTVDGFEYASISGKKTADGKDEFISDRLSGYATSFVDVAKDPYIMKIITSDSLVGVFMFLERLGVGENTVWFLNQPIIKAYMEYLDSIGTKGFFGKKNREYIRSLFPTTEKDVKLASINVNDFKSNIKTYYEKGGLDAAGNAVQQLIFTEFLKYAKMAEYNFKLTQATNYDTTKFRNSDEFGKKRTRTIAARKSNIFSSVDKILDSSFIGEQSKFIDKAMSSMGAIVKTEQDDFTVITDEVLKPFQEKEFISGDEFNKVAGKIKSSFIDFIVQTQGRLNSEIKELVVDSSSVADQLAAAKKRRPEMKILNELQVVSSDRIDGAKSVRLRANLKDAYDENMYTDMMRELKVVEPELYKGLLKVAILQGSYQTAISIRNIMPIEDFAPLIKDTVEALRSTEDVKSFSKSGAFYRNNWKDDVVVPSTFPRFFPVSEEPVEMDELENDIYQYYSPAFPNIDVLNILSTDRKVLLINEKYNSDTVKHDFVKIPRVVNYGTTGEKIDIKTGKTITNVMFAKQRSEGDFSLNNIYGYKKVKYSNGEPVVTAKGEHVYKLVNLHGDGQLLSEYYTDGRKSVLNNGTVKIDNEISDAELIKLYGNQEIIEKPVVPSQAISFEQSFSTERQEEIVNNFATKHNLTKEAALEYIKKAVASKGQEVIDKLKECY